MKLLFLIFCAAAACAAGGSTVRIEKWRVKTGDDIRWAQPNLDDSSWQASDWPKRYNTTQQFFAGVRWYRGTVTLPPRFIGQPLAIGISPLNEVFDVYVNGIRVGTFGSWDPAPVGYFERFLSFPIPETAWHGPVAVVAIRRWTGRSRTNFAVFSATLLGHAVAPEIGPLELEEVFRDLRAKSGLSNYTARLVTALCELTTGLISFALFFASRRKRFSNLWLGVPLITGSITALAASLAALSNIPLRSPIVAIILALQILTPGLWSVFLASICPWLRKPLWITALLQVVVAIALAISYATQWEVSPLLLQLTNTWLGMGTSFAAAIVLWADRRSAYSSLLAVALFLRPASAFWFTQIANWLKIADESRYFHIDGTLVDPRDVSRIVFAITALVVLYLRHRKEQELQAEELTAARLVQESLLLSRGSDSTRYTVDAAYLPASEVGGDFYQKLVQEDGTLMMLVGDVSGKGLHAAMLVSHVCGALSNERSREPATVLSNLNISLTGRVRGGFITCCCARFDPDGSVTMANAGHLPPYMGGHEWVLEPGLPLGISAAAEFTEERRQLSASESVVFVSDGVVEAANAKGELFGFDRTREIAKQSAGEIAKAAEAWGQNDDITVVAVRRHA